MGVAPYKASIFVDPIPINAWKMQNGAVKSGSHSESYKPLFKTVFPDLVKELTDEGLQDPEISDGIRHLQGVGF